ncbi:serine acetyltransferase [Myroides odoratimimus]|uniref:serine acetyltransferase n=1 Tax=Myroides odoratimimus TaxID=76832 RepID=UPI002DB93625|nr:DapH/DapD/GlmU-related protein [Myroides odoratimimus]MEC4086899.1 DapH/DapD/GlmU-related protein [Myroides odoratimimus]
MKFKEVLKYIKSDLFRYQGKIGLRGFIKEYFLNRGFCLTVWFRMSKIDNKVISTFSKIWLYTKRMRYNIDISHKTNIGYGLYIGHSGPIVINSTTIIGNNCNLSQFVSIGANDTKGAEIGDNVYIGPNCCVVENVKIGNDVTIGAGSVVTKDLPNNSTAVGNYAKVINYKSPGRYIVNKYTD